MIGLMTKSKDKKDRELRSVRDTVESVWVAVVLAFVLRAFMIEAFVIPTGSMAPRLLGEHWQLVCPACGYDFSYGLPRKSQTNGSLDRRQKHPPAGAVCPNCNCQYPATRLPSLVRGGDRVLVMKYLYRIAEPEPWDVVVFRNPQNNRENYIKRLIGLPGETIEIVHGDVFVDDGNGKWQIRRKPASAQEAMWQVIYDNDYPPDFAEFRDLNRSGQTVPQWLATSDRWDLSCQDGRRFRFSGGAQADVFFQSGSKLFLPHYGYNRPGVENQGIDAQKDICSDLKLSVAYFPESSNSAVGLSLTSFEDSFKASLSADGTIQLWHSRRDESDDGWQLWGKKRVPALRPGRAYPLAITHADFRVGVWLDGELVLSSSDEQYSADHTKLRNRMHGIAEMPIPLPEVRISAEFGSCELRHVRLHRDVYYTSPLIKQMGSGPLWDFAEELKVRRNSPGWGTTDNPIKLAKYEDKPELDQFFMLGDNSPQSLDGRGWVRASPTLRLRDGLTGEITYQLGTVPRYALIGKAFFVYWPAGFGVPALPGLPIVPNVGRMRLIR